MSLDAAGAAAHVRAAPHDVAHQFDTAEQQYGASTLGMWIFLVTEVMFFGAILAAFLISFVLHTEAFEAASNHLSLLLGGVNTIVLLTSSLTMALAVRAAQTGQRSELVRDLLLTLLLGLVFLGIKAYEYTHKFHEGLVPGPLFTYGGGDAPQHELFLSFYFALTGLHALHMIIGVALLGILIVLARRDWFGPKYYTPIEVSGLYWHFVDLVWIFLFPLLYLLGRH